MPAFAEPATILQANPAQNRFLKETPVNTEPALSSARTGPTTDTLRHIVTFVIGCFALFVVATGHGNSPDNASHPTTVDELKRAYLLCNRTAMSGAMEHTAAMQCSVLYEQLKERAFDGDFFKLLEWSRAQSPEQNTDDRSQRTILDEQQ